MTTAVNTEKASCSSPDDEIDIRRKICGCGECKTHMRMDCGFAALDIVVGDFRESVHTEVWAQLHQFFVSRLIVCIGNLVNAMIMMICIGLSCWLSLNTISRVFLVVWPRLVLARYCYLAITTLWICGFGYWWKWGSPINGLFAIPVMFFLRAVWAGLIIIPLVLICPSILSIPAVVWVAYYAYYEINARVLSATQAVRGIALDLRLAQLSRTLAAELERIEQRLLGLCEDLGINALLR